MAVPGLYIPIRGDYSQFQQDMNRVAGIARENAKDIAEALNLAISPDKVYKGLKGIGSALKQLTAAAQSTGKAFYAPIRELDELAKKANVTSGVVEELHYAMISTARDHQIEQSLRAIQKQCGLTEDAVARLQAQMGDTAGSIDTAMKALGVRSAQAIKKEMASLEASFDHAIKHGNLTVKEQERLVDALEKKWAALNAEMGVMPVKHPFFAAKETLGIRETGDVRAEAQQARQAYETIQQSAWKTREMSVSAHEAMVASLKKLAQELRLTASETSKFIAAFAGSKDALDSAMGAMGLKSTRAIKNEIAEVNRLLHRVESSASATLEDKERALAWAAKRTDALTREMRAPGQLTANERYEQATGLLGMKTDAYYRQQAKAIAQAYLEVRTNARSSAEDVSRAHARMIESFRQLREEMNSWRPQTQTVDPAKVLGIRTNSEIRADIAALQQAFMQFSLAPGRAADEVERAKTRMLAAIRQLNAEMGVATAQDRRDGFLKLLGIRSVADIENDKQALINAHRQIVNEFQRGIGGWSEQDLRNSLAARNAGLQRLAQEAGTWQAGARAEVSPLRQKYNTLSAQAGGAGVSFGQYEAKSKAGEAVKAFQELHGRLPKYAKEFRDLAAAAGTSTREIWRMRDALDQSSNAFKALIGYGQVWMTFGFAHTAVDFIKTAMTLENVEVAFKAIYGTTDMAQKKLEFVRQVSDELGLSFLDTAEGAKKLFAAAQGTPIEAEANMVFKAFSNMSAAMKLTGDETKGVFLAISQMISKGKVSAEELRQQLAERMPGAVNLFAKSIGVSTQELDKMLQAGGVTLEHFLTFAREVNSRYSTGARQASHTLQAELARVGNTWAEFQQKMTDTGQLAGWVRSFNDAFKSVTSAIVECRDEVGKLMTAGLAAWLASSCVPGGKLNAIVMALGASFKTTTRHMKLFEAFSLSMNASVGRATLAVGKLRIALGALMRNPVVAGLLTAGTVFGIEKLLEPGDDDRFKGEIVSSGDSIQEKLRKRMQSEAADKNSSFNPAIIRKSLLDDINKEMAALEQGTAAAGERFNDAIFAAYKEGQGMFSDVPEDQYIKMGEARAKAFEQFRSFQEEMKNLVDAKDADGLLKLQDAILQSWEGIGKSLKEAGFKDDAVKSMEDLFNQLHNVAGLGFDDISKLLGTFSNDSINAAKDLGLEMDKATKKMFDGLEKAAQSSALGKAAKELQDFEKVARQMGDVGKDLKFDTVIASCGQYSDSIVNVTNRLDGAYQKHEEFSRSLEVIRERALRGSASYNEVEKAQAQVTAQTAELDKWQQQLAQSIFNASAAAGGSPAAFNAMISVFEQAAKAAGWTAEQISQIVGELQRVQAQAIETMNAAASAAAISGAENALLGTEAQTAYAKGDFESWYAINQYKDSGSGKGVASREARKRQWDLMKENDRRRKQLQEAAKAGKKGGKGGGGGKRVDNTEEKWHSAEEGWRKKIADMQGQKDVATLAKDFADMDKQLKGSSVDMKALKKDYLEAFNTKYTNDLNKEILQLRGNEAELAKIDIEEKYKAKAAAIEGMAEEAKKLGITVQDQTPKLAEYRKLLEGQAREQQLQKELPYYEKFSWFDGMKNEALAKQNELIAIQAEKMKGTIPDELIDRWRQIEELQNRVKNGNDVLAGIQLGAKQYALEIGNLAEGVSGLVQKSFDSMTDAFTDLVITGKASFTDLANSIIKDLMRIAIQQAIVGPIANGIGSLFSGLFGGGGTALSSGNIATMNANGMVSTGGWGLTGVHGHAFGDVFTGLHGFSNQIVTRPTLFSYGSQLTKFAKGGVMGEAGAEAVMPLTRTASGHLGVRSEGSQAPVVNVVINNSTGQAARQQTKTDNQGNKSIEVMVGDMAAQQMMKTGTALNKAARSFSGVSQQVTRR